MNSRIMIRFLCALGVAFIIILFTDYTEKYIGQKDLSGNKNASGIQKPKIKKVKKLRIHSTVDWEKSVASLHWKPVKNISRYKIACYIVQDEELWEPEEIEEKDITLEDISEEGELFFSHQIVYGTKYEYEVRLYRDIREQEQWTYVKEYDFDMKPADLVLENQREETEEYARLTIYPYADFATPTGVQIFRGTNKEEMQLIDTVMWDELSDLYPEKKYNQDRQYTDKQKSYMACYQVRSFVDIGEERYYGKKSEIIRFLAPEANGDMDVKINIADKSQIEKLEIVLTNRSGQPIYAGMPYIENYNKEHGDNYAFMFYDEGEEYPRPPICSSAELQIDEISYKSHPSDQYQILSKKDSITIKPKETIYLCFSRKDHKKFRNFFKDDSADSMCIYLFQYLGEKVFLRVSKENYSYMGWDKDDEPDMRAWYSWIDL